MAYGEREKQGTGMTDTSERRLKQGQHPDPLDPEQARPEPSAWSERQRRAWSSKEMQEYQRALLLDGKVDTRSGVLDDLSSFFDISPEAAVQRCINWEQWSVEE